MLQSWYEHTLAMRGVTNVREHDDKYTWDFVHVVKPGSERTNHACVEILPT